MLIDGLPLDAPAAPLSDLLRVGLDAGGEELALVSATRSMSWRELRRRASGLPAATGSWDCSQGTGSPR